MSADEIAEHGGWSLKGTHVHRYNRPDEVDVTTYKGAIANMWMDDFGDWWLTVEGTDIREHLWHDQDVQPGVFPGTNAGARLITLGWVPDRSDKSWHGSGWKPRGQGAWTIPCSREE